MTCRSKIVSSCCQLFSWRTLFGVSRGSYGLVEPCPAAWSGSSLSTLAFNDASSDERLRFYASGSNPGYSAFSPELHRQAAENAQAQHTASTPRLGMRPLHSQQRLSESMLRAQARGQHDSVLSLFAASQLGDGLPAQDLKQVYELALRSCAATGRADRALQLVAQMWRRSVYVGPAAHLSAVHSLCAAGRLQDALAYLVSIPSKDRKGRKRLRVFMCNAVLLAAVKRGELGVARGVEALMRERGVRPDHLSHAAIMELRGLEGDAAAVHAVWDQASAAGLCSADHPQLHAARVLALARAGQLVDGLAAAEAMMDVYAQLLPVEISTPALLPFGHPQQQPFPLGGVSLGEFTSGGEAGVSVAAVGERSGGGAAAGRGDHTDPLTQLRAACDALLRKAEEMGDQGVVKRLTALMTLRGLPPGTTTFNVLLRATVARSHDAAAAVQAVQDGMREMEALGVPPNRETLELLLETQGWAGDLGGVRHTLEDMEERGWEPTLGAWSGVMRCYGAEGDLEGVSHTYEQMMRRGVPPSAGIYRAAFDALKGWGERQAAQRALHEAHFATFTNHRIHQKQLAVALLQRWAADMEANGISHTPASLTALLHALGYAGQSDTVVRVMHSAFPPPTPSSRASSGSTDPGSTAPKDTTTSSSSSSTTTTTTTTTSSSSSSKAHNNVGGFSDSEFSDRRSSSSSSSSSNSGVGVGRGWESREVRERLSGLGGSPSPPSPTATATSTASSSGGGGAAAQEAGHAAVAGSGSPAVHRAPPPSSARERSTAGPSRAAADAAVRSHHDRHAAPVTLAPDGQDPGEGECSSRVFEGAAARAQMPPDPRIFSAAISACGRLGKLEDAMELLRLMRSHSLDPSVHTYTSLIACCAYLHMPHLARTLLDDMRAGGVPPSLFTYNALLKVECHCGSLDSALRLLNEMEWQGHPPDAVSWRTILSAARFLGRDDVAEMALRQLAGEVPGEEEAGVEEAGAAREEEGAGRGEGPRAQGDPDSGHAAPQVEEGWHGFYATSDDDDD